MEKRIAIITKQEQHSWHSCKIISSNLLQCYQLSIPEKYREFFYTEDTSNDFHTLQLVKKLCSYKPDLIIFTEHAPHPKSVLEFYYKISAGNNLPNVIFHIYGDFALNAGKWFDLSKTLMHYKTKFVCASDAQHRFLSQFMHNNDLQIYTCPFSVNTNLFCFDSTIRQTKRLELNISDSEVVFLYTGRLSQQKRITELVNIFSKLSTFTASSMTLLLAGPFDDLGVPYLEKRQYYNSYYTNFNHLIQNLGPNISSKVVYLGNLDSIELHKVYCASDVFISLSTHNDEDFGMSPAEALCSGLQCILTKWGGYSSFQLNEMKSSCSLLPVEIRSNKLEINISRALKEMFNRTATINTDSDRITISTTYSQKYSIQSISSVLYNIRNEEFRNFMGFKKLLSRISKTSESKSPFTNDKKTYNNIYKKIYQAYVE